MDLAFCHVQEQFPRLPNVLLIPFRTNHLNDRRLMQKTEASDSQYKRKDAHQEGGRRQDDLDSLPFQSGAQTGKQAL